MKRETVEEARNSDAVSKMESSGMASAEREDSLARRWNTRKSGLARVVRAAVFDDSGVARSKRELRSGAASRMESSGVESAERNSPMRQARRWNARKSNATRVVHATVFDGSGVARSKREMRM